MGLGGCYILHSIRSRTAVDTSVMMANTVAVDSCTFRGDAEWSCPLK